ncbi:hypothetical protein BH10PLA2_BH10PLA2_05920 [soil metagenome]
MERFARIVVGYHGCTREYARGLLLGDIPILDWKPSKNNWDWLGHGIYFWEHSPDRAYRWAKERFTSADEEPDVLGAIIQLGQCFDLLDEGTTRVLGAGYHEVAQGYGQLGRSLPANRGIDWKRRELDCLVLNNVLDYLQEQNVLYDTVRGAFLEGEPVFPGAGIRHESHIQIAVRNPNFILGVFRPNNLGGST